MTLDLALAVARLDVAAQLVRGGRTERGLTVLLEVRQQLASLRLQPAPRSAAEVERLDAEYRARAAEVHLATASAGRGRTSPELAALKKTWQALGPAGRCPCGALLRANPATGRRRFWCEKHRRSADHLELVREGLEREGVS